jgi:hypothetical protein
MRNHLRMATLLFASIALGSGAAFAHDDKMQMEMHHHGLLRQRPVRRLPLPVRALRREHSDRMASSG